MRLVEGGLDAVWGLGIETDRILAVDVLQFLPDQAAPMSSQNVLWRDDQDGNRVNHDENRGGRVER